MKKFTKWEKKNANLAVAYALKIGSLKREPCKICKSRKNIEAHHPDYARPLFVVWLCRAHHRAEHKQLRKKNPVKRKGNKGMTYTQWGNAPSAASLPLNFGFMSPFLKRFLNS